MATDLRKMLRDNDVDVTHMSDKEMLDTAYGEYKSVGGKLALPEFAESFGFTVERGLGESLVKGVVNFPASVGNVLLETAKGVGSIVTDPIGVGKGLYGLGKSVANKISGPWFDYERKQLEDAGIAPKDTALADEALASLRASYGSWPAIKNTIATDPARPMADLAMVLSPAGLARKAAGAKGRVAQALDTTSRYIDPVNLSLMGSTALAKGALPYVTGALAGVSAPTVRRVYSAGKEGGARSDAVTRQMRGLGTPDEIVTAAEAGLGKLFKQRQESYLRDMARFSAGPLPVIPFTNIDNAVDAVRAVGISRGRSGTSPGVVFNPAAEDVWGRIDKQIGIWRGLDPLEFHSLPEMDQLKRAIGSIRDSVPLENGPARLVANEAYNAIYAEIIRADTGGHYARAMRDYEEASKQLNEFKRTLSLNRKATLDTKFRKLMSSTRDNVTANWGVRRNQVEQLDRAGGEMLQDQLAGMAMSSGMPGGLGRLGWVGEGATAAAAVARGDWRTALAMMAAGAASSPRLVGELTHLAGTASRTGVPPRLRALRQAGYGASKIPPPAEDER